MSVLMRPEPELAEGDPEVATLVADEIEWQSSTICLIPYENYVSRAVLEAMGSVFTNKYSEGYAGRRYYEGQQVVDRLEPLAVERAKRLFQVEHANVQPCSGSPANLALYLAFCEPENRGRVCEPYAITAIASNRLLGAPTPSAARRRGAAAPTRSRAPGSAASPPAAPHAPPRLRPGNSHRSICSCLRHV
jgi:glycine/serine hydroxymethyltransferase